MDRHVPLNRLFSPIRDESDDIDEGQSGWGLTSPNSWDELEREFRCVILAEAGAGKTEELKLRAYHLKNQGKPSFFIRIEDIENDFYEAFEVGDEDQFHAWRQSTEEAWFFLDSIDEARLESPIALRKALRRFSIGIRGSEHRAHIYLSSRPYAWHPKEDRKLFDESLFLRAPSDTNGDSEQPNEVASALKVYTMLPLDIDRIRQFSDDQGARDIEGLLMEIDRTNLWSLAERPFDLEGILIKWNEDHVLGSRLDLLKHNIDTRLRDDHNTDRAQLQPLNLELAKEGVRCLAAAVVLSGKPGLNVPDSIQIKPGIDAESVLVDWRPQEVRALLERGIFNDIIYGAVRFRHREVLELLAAEWFDGLLRRGGSRTTIKALFFREQYGEKIVTPRLRSVLHWLILFDDAIRLSALQIIPELAVEGGDPSRLPLRERQEILANIVRRIANNEDGRTARDHSAIARIANPELSPDTLQLINTYRNNDDAIFFLGRLAWQGNMSACIHPLAEIAVDPTRGIYARVASARAVLACGSVEDKRFIWRQINQSDSLIPHQLLAEILDGAVPELESVEQFLSSLRKLPPLEPFASTELRSAIHNFIDRIAIDPKPNSATQLINGLRSYLETEPYIERGECHVSKQYAWLLGPAIHTAERLIKHRSSESLSTDTLSILLMVPALRVWHGSDFNDYKDNLSQIVPAWPELNDALYWTSIDQARQRQASTSAEPLVNDRQVSWLGHFWHFDESSLPRLLGFIRSRTSLQDKLVALSTAFRVYLQSDSSENILRYLEEAATGYTELRDRFKHLT